MCEVKCHPRSTSGVDRFANGRDAKGACVHKDRNASTGGQGEEAVDLLGARARGIVDPEADPQSAVIQPLRDRRLHGGNLNTAGRLIGPGRERT